MPTDDGFKLQRPADTTPSLYSQDGKGMQATVHAHYFIGGCDWFVTEYDPKQDLAFGWACLNGDRHNAELGYVSLAELAEVRVVGIFPVEHDDHWEPVTLEKAIAELDERQGRT